MVSLEYDPNRTSDIALLQYKDGEKRYILAPLDLKLGDVIMAGEDIDLKIGNQNFDQAAIRILDQRDGRVDHLRQVVRRNVGGHAHGDAVRAVHNQRRNARRQNRWLPSTVSSKLGVISTVSMSMSAIISSAMRSMRHSV